MLKIGITGGMGSGKSVVSRLFSLLGVPVFYADTEAKKLMQKDPQLIANIKTAFGESIYDERLHLNKKKLAEIVFNSEEKLKTLNNLVHPSVFFAFGIWADQRLKHDYVLKEAALIFETGMEHLCDYVMVVTCPLNLRVQRVMKRDTLTETEVVKRMNRQWSEEEKLKKADFVIINDEVQALIPQVQRIHQRLIR